MQFKLNTTQEADAMTPEEIMLMLPSERRRLFYIWFVGEIPPGYILKPSCGNPECQDADHAVLICTN